MASTAEESEVMERFAQSVIHDEALKNAVVNYAVARKYGMVPERQPEDDIAGVQASNEETPANGQKNSARTPETDEHTPTKKKGKQQCVRRLTATNHLCASSFAGKLVNKRRLGKPLVPMVFEEIINELDSETRFDFSNMAYKRENGKRFVKRLKKDFQRRAGMGKWWDGVDEMLSQIFTRSSN